MYDISFFDEELDLITNNDLRAMTAEVLTSAPAWFWIEPASLSGKFHPPDDLVEGGLCIHSKKVAWLAHKFFEVSDLDTDIGTSAALLHDIHQRGSEDTVGDLDDYKNHGPSAAEHLRGLSLPESFFTGAECEKLWQRTCACVETHMGKYGDVLPQELDQKLLHLADVAASFRLLVGLPFYTDDIPALIDVMDSGKHFVERDGVLVFNFGKKHFREPVEEVIKTDPGYIRWLVKSGFPDETLQQIRKILEKYRREEKKRIQLETGNLTMG